MLERKKRRPSESAKDEDVSKPRLKEKPKQASSIIELRRDVRALGRVIQGGARKMSQGANPIQDLCDRIDKIERTQMTLLEEIAQIKSGQNETIQAVDLLTSTLRDVLHS